MNKGRIYSYRILARLSLTVAVICCMWSYTGYAQQGNPEVYIDMGVLQGLGTPPNATGSPAQPPIKLKPPSAKPAATPLSQPQLITPTQQAPTAPVRQPIAKAPPKPEPVSETEKPPVPQEKPKAPQPALVNIVSKPPAMPADEIRKVVAKPVGNKASESVPPLPAPTTVKERVVEEVSAISPSPPSQTPAETPKAIAFPIETKVRKETSDPAVSSTSRPVPVRSGIAGNLNDAVLSRPAPDFDPGAAKPDSVPVRDLTEDDPVLEKKPSVAKSEAVKAAPVIPGRKPSIPGEIKVTDKPANPEQAATATNIAEVKPAAEVKPPIIPPRRPDNVQQASPELVAELRAREAEKQKQLERKQDTHSEVKSAAIDLANPPPPPGPRGKKNMPAVAKATVDAEPLAEQTIKLQAEADPLLDSLVEKDKESLVATIESMVAEREDGVPLPETKKVKREQGTNIVKAEPMQRPYNVYRPKKDKKAEDATEEPLVEEEKIAALEELPAAEPIAPRPPPPRDQDEQAYVSVPFAQGLTEIDNQITAEIEEKLLPVLNNNPGWKLQIQAFASPVKDGTSSARKASLARAMSVRSFLLSKGIEATRMDIRALGAESDRDPMDRVDLIVFDPAKKS